MGRFSPRIPRRGGETQPSLLGTVSRFAKHAFWPRVAPEAGAVAEHATRAMRLVGRMHVGSSVPYSPLAGMALDAFIGLQRVGTPSKRAWAMAPHQVAWVLDAETVVKQAGLVWHQRDPHGPRGIDEVFLRIVVPEGFRELAESVRQLLWRVPPGRCPEPDEASALFAVGIFEGIYRAGASAGGGLALLRPLISNRRELRKKLAALFPGEVLEEFRRTCQRMLLLLPREQPFIYNPRWRRVGRLAGSDGDFISGRTLYDVKCVDPAKGGFSQENLFQLLGYACQNACDLAGYQLGALGLLNPRAGFVWSMELDSLCRAIGAGSFENVLQQFREETAVPKGGSPR